MMFMYLTMLCAGSDPEMIDSCSNAKGFGHGIDAVWTVEGSALTQRCKIACTQAVFHTLCFVLAA